MDNITGIIAANVQNIRKQRNLTLQNLADLTGVSKSMLGEIERGVSNPTIVILWKISAGLRVPISQLIGEQLPNFEVVRQNDWKTLADEGYQISMIFGNTVGRSYEIYHLTYQPNAIYGERKHQKGLMEYLMVYEGQFVVSVGGQDYTLSAGDSFFFDGATEHSYKNLGTTVAKAYSILDYT